MSRPNRWRAARRTAACLLCGLLSAHFAGLAGAAAPGRTPALPVSVRGPEVPEMASYDCVVGAFMARWRVPGGAVAVVRDGRLVYARGFGWADEEARLPVEPDALFRLASLSKSLTAAAVLKLAEDGKLRLDDKAFALLQLAPRPGARMNPDLQAVTVRHLLQHTGGWDRDQSFDPMFRSRDIARDMGVPPPAGAEAIVRWMLDQPLQFAPGSRYAYSNFGYCVLGRIVEKVAGEPYEAYVRRAILRPAGITAMRIGHTLPAGRAPREVRYFEPAGTGLARSVFPGPPPRVPWPYGGWYLEAMEAHGAWIASALDMARFVGAVDGRGHIPQVLRPESIHQMVARPRPPVAVGADTWYGMGWQVRPADGDANWWHTGSLDGTTTLMVRAANGLTWVALFNLRPKDSDKMAGELDAAMWRAAGQVKSWPSHDLWQRFGY